MGPYAGGAVARRIEWRLRALVVTAVGLAAIVRNAIAIPHSPWRLAVGVSGVCTVGWRFLGPALSFGS